MKMISSLILCLIAVYDPVFGWNYDASSASGPSNWVDTYPNCGLNSQSPVDITSASCTVDSSLSSFTFGSAYTATSGIDYTLSNTGHGAKVAMTDSAFTLDGGNLTAGYTLEQFHFHWGSVSSQGSEHTIDGNMYPAELHLVHYLTSLGSVTGAVTDGSATGLAVLGFFLEVSTSNNTYLQEFLDSVADIENTDDSITATVSTFNVHGMISSALSGGYYRYSGGLTTPSCDEIVVWTVFKTPLTISELQLAELRTLIDTAGVSTEDNYRPVQSINGRSVYCSSAHYIRPAVMTIASIAYFTKIFF